MFNRKLVTDIGLAMLLALPAVAPAVPSPRTVEAHEALANKSAEPQTLAMAVANPRPEVRPNLGEGL